MLGRSRAWVGRAARTGTVLAAVVCLVVSVPGDAASGEVKVQGSLPINYAFKPGTIRVDVNETVTWTNETDTAHTVTSDSFNGALAAQGQLFSHKFSQPGTYAYYCNYHRITAGMTGAVVVGAASSPSVAPTPTSDGSSATPSPAVTRTITPSPSPTRTASPSPSPTPPASPTPVASPTPTASPTPSPSATPSASPSPDEPLGASPTSGGGPSVPLILGIVGLLVAAGAGGGLLWLRRQPGVPPPGGGVG